MRGLIGGQDAAVRIGCQDSDWTAFDQYPQLLFGVATRIALAFELVNVFLCYAAVPVHLANKEPCSSKGANLPAGQHTSNHQHGYQVEESEQNLSNHPPVQKRNGCNQEPRLEQYSSLVALEKQAVHRHLLCCAGEIGIAARIIDTTCAAERKDSARAGDLAKR